MFEIKDYAANYFLKAHEIIKKYKPNDIVTMQFFQRKNNVKLSGIKEVLTLLEKHTNTSKYKIKYLEDGEIINSKEVVLELEGKYTEFGILEGIIDGILARNTSIATNIYHCMQAAPKKEIIFMGDRADLYLNQESDGYSTKIAGINAYSTNAQANGKSELVFGSIPHVLIQHFKGNQIEALKAYQEMYPEDDLIGLPDYNNDVITESLKILKEFGKKLIGVRVDTSKSVKDKYFENEISEEFYGSNPHLIKALRRELDLNNGKHVKIIVSSGFNPSKIQEFEKANSPVDSYGVGEYIMGITTHFTCDAVKLNGEKVAKIGREYFDTNNSKRYKVYLGSEKR
ncbi:nicotinate phosphoribosyltransferase [[Mycoplasma] mobile]|uniref:nicotinate phosphoribosyltransferase n=1 Tax=Mycoplasma mobile (strain ATCC 43663 / 163K / NCTC 11711) TaxID=267748 RepID=Q6KHX8_MYCM1|nr:nicotinate phosphoribosyltransferase [[Mycoplasma] mobile]AAT27798.1 nicotinic acid phosphoribosyltransferase [Mycoplasma mobile 163K]